MTLKSDRLLLDIDDTLKRVWDTAKWPPRTQINPAALDFNEPGLKPFLDLLEHEAMHQQAHQFYLDHCLKTEAALTEAVCDLLIERGRILPGTYLLMVDGPGADEMSFYTMPDYSGHWTKRIPFQDLT